MPDPSLKSLSIDQLLPRVQGPGQYIGGEWNSICKNRDAVRGTLCLAFPDVYAIGMSHPALHVLYAIVNSRGNWACERCFTPQADMEALLRQHATPLVSLESFTPLRDFDCVVFSLQNALSATNVLTMLDLGGIPLAGEDRSMADPLVVGEGPCTDYPEPMARFLDAFVLGDGDVSLPALFDRWIEIKRSSTDRADALAQLAVAVPFVYVPRFYETTFNAQGRPVGVRAIRDGMPSLVQPIRIDDLDAIPLALAPVVPHIECAEDRIAIEIMRASASFGTLQNDRFRSVDVIVRAAVAAYRATGHDEIALLGTTTTNHPFIEELLRKLRAIFRLLNVRITMPSVPINERLPAICDLLDRGRPDGLTLSPEAACADLRQRIGIHFRNEALFDGCRRAMENGVSRFKLNFLCGLPGERPADLDGIIDMAEQVSRLGGEVLGRHAGVVANVVNFIPKSQTPLQGQAMQTGDYFEAAHEHLRKRKRMRDVTLRCRDVESSLVEAALCRGDRRFGPVIETVWRRGARLESLPDRLRPWLWWQAISEADIECCR